jgi:hypothetical protein
LKKQLALLALATFAMTSCSAPSQPAEGAPTTQSAASSKTNDRGNVPKAIGDTAAIGGDSPENSAVRFKVTSIQPFQCTREPDYGPGNGHVLAVTIAVETGKDMTQQTEMDTLSFNAAGWKGYAADGSRMNTVSSDKIYNCLDDRTVLLPDDIGPGEKATGIVLLDAPNLPGSLAFSFPAQGNGWEWEYPAS